MAEPKDEREDPRKEEQRSVFREYLEAILIAAVFLGFTNTFVVKTFYIPSESMVDTLLVGDHLFVNRYVYGPVASSWLGPVLPAREPRRGDIVIFRSPESLETDLVKRCIGLPGDRIQVVDKELFVNGVRVEDDSYTQHVEEGVFAAAQIFQGKRYGNPRDNFGPFTVPANEYFFMGDNRDRSNDSRYWGTVPRHLIKGRASIIYWSYEGRVSDGEWRGWGRKIGQVLETAAGFLTRTRWGRTFHLVR